MRRVILQITTSLDGFIADEDGCVDWLPNGDIPEWDYSAFYASFDAVLLGANTYEQIIGWDIPFPYADKPCYVFTSRRGLPSAAESVVFVHDDPADFVAGLKETEGGPIWLVGGGWLFVRLWDDGLVDEVDIVVQPIVLGDGVPLFPAAHARRTVRLAEAQAWSGDMVRLRYDVTRE